MGQAPLRGAGDHLQAHRGRGARRQPRVLRHHEQAARDHRVGVIKASCEGDRKWSPSFFLVHRSSASPHGVLLYTQAGRRAYLRI